MDNKNDENIAKKITIKDFFSEKSINEISIPIIQRDYAQGRADKGYIRKRFLESIHDAIENNRPKLLDFVYGREEENCFYPLDGQQRLTSLWLIYWYLSLRFGKKKEFDNLKKFSYETRKSSRDFCRALCDINHFKNVDLSDDSFHIVDYIKKQTWFLSKWQEDPTIKSMLTMLSGTSEKARDGIEIVFRNLYIDDPLEKYKKNVSFYEYIMNEDVLKEEKADRLYVKMNARGKALSDFENFKADFLDSLSKKIDEVKAHEIIAKMDNEWNNVFWKAVNAGETDGKTDEVFFSFINRFCFGKQCLVSYSAALKQDQKDTKNYKNPGTEDYMLEEDEDNVDIVDGSLVNTQDIPESRITDDDKYEYFFNEVDSSYEIYDYYEEVLSVDNVNKLGRIFEALTGNENLENIQDDIKNEVNSVAMKRITDNEYKNKFGERCCLIPQYKYDEEGKKIKKLDKTGKKVGVVKDSTLWSRVYFFALCKFFEKSEYDQNKFKNWLRVCRNLIENSGIESQTAMILCINVIDILGEQPSPKKEAKTEEEQKEEQAEKVSDKVFLDIYEYLKMTDVDFIRTELGKRIKTKKDSKLFRQLDEEIFKAQKIHENENKEELIKLIEEADKLLCGKIRFLFTNENGEMVLNEQFRTKYNNLKNEYYKGEKVFELDFVKKMVVASDNIWNDSEIHNEKDDLLIFHNKVYGRRGDSWLDVLCVDKWDNNSTMAKKLYGIVHRVLMNENDINTSNDSLLGKFINTKSFEMIIKKEGPCEKEESLRISDYNKKKALYKKSHTEKLYFDGNNFKRNEYLFSLKERKIITIDSRHFLCAEEPYYWGEDVCFEFCENWYAWNGKNDEIYKYDMQKKERKNTPLIKDASSYFDTLFDPLKSSEYLKNELKKSLEKND